MTINVEMKMELINDTNASLKPMDGGASATPSRRSFIRLVGGGAVLAATASLAGCSNELPEAAIRPWRSPDRETDMRRFMLAHALLAPNPHNLQPWIADLREAGRIHLNCDAERVLPETDPFGRQILIGFGTFIELAVIAAAQRGVAVNVELFPGGAPADQQLPKGSRVATLFLGDQGSAPADPLFAQIVRRHTRKSAYANDRALRHAGTQLGRDGQPLRLAQRCCVRCSCYGSDSPYHARGLRDRGHHGPHLARIGTRDAHRPQRHCGKPRWHQPQQTDGEGAAHGRTL